MQDNAEAALKSKAGHVARFICRDVDGLWVGIERALDNGFGAVFLTDAAGVMVGIVELDHLRAAVRKGAHLNTTRLAELAVSWPPAGKQAATLTPILDEENRIIDVSICPEAELLPVAEPDLTHLEFRNLVDAFLSTWISSIGEYVRSFEQTFARKVGMDHGVATSNGTVSLQLALAALGIGAGDEVVVPDFTFAATASAVIHVGARPILVDVDPDTWCVSVEAIEQALTPNTRAIIPVHVFGRPAPMTEIAALAKARGLFIIEDCAEAHGARYDGRPVGSFSDIASFSFYGNKIITTGEGGICLCNDAGLAQRMRMLRDHGMRPDRRYWHEEPGFNFRMTNLQASIGCAQLERMDELIAMRQNVHDTYEKAFAHVPTVVFPRPMSARCEPVVWFSSALTPAEKRDNLIAACRAANIDLRPFFHSLGSMPAFKQYKRPCPVSTHLSMSGINLPTMRKVDARVAAKIADIFSSVLA